MPYSGRRLTGLLARWGARQRLSADLSAAIHRAIVSTPAPPGFDWWWRLLDPTDGSAFRKSRWTVEAMSSSPASFAPPAGSFSPGVITTVPWTGVPDAWEPDEGEYQPYLRLG